MPADIRTDGAERFAALAKTLRQIADKELRRELFAGINRSVKPLTAAVRMSVPRFLPDRYAAELAKSLRVRVRSRGGRNPSVTLVGSAKTSQGKERHLAALNRGRLMHPLYGNRRHWFVQHVSPNWWDEPLQEGADEVREEFVNVLDEIGRKLARKL